MVVNSSFFTSDSLNTHVYLRNYSSTAQICGLDVFARLFAGGQFFFINNIRLVSGIGLIFKLAFGGNATSSP